MADHVIELEVACEPCKSTGLYVGMGERDGAAVVCSRCKGTGKAKYRHEYSDFTGRKEREGIRHVVAVNPGICIGEGRGLKLEDFGGMSYEDWKKGTPFERGMENREYTCPAWWYQSFDYKRKPKWDDCGFGSFSACPSFQGKAKCWERFDKENR